MAFASPDLPVPEVVEVGEAFDGAYATSVRWHGINFEDVRRDQSDTAGLMLASLLAALFKVPKSLVRLTVTVQGEAGFIG